MNGWTRLESTFGYADFYWVNRARAVESVIRIALEDQPKILDGFLSAGAACLARADEWGYGIVGFIAVNDSANLFEKILAPDGEISERTIVRERSEFLMNVALGRQVDA